MKTIKSILWYFITHFLSIKVEISHEYEHLNDKKSGDKFYVIDL